MNRGLAALCATIVCSYLAVAVDAPAATAMSRAMSRAMPRAMSKQDRPVQAAVTPISPEAAQPDAAEKAVSPIVPLVRWPHAAAAELAPGEKTSVVTLRSATKNKAAGRVRVEVLDRQRLEKHGLTGIPLRMRTMGDQAEATVEVDYSAFRTASGGHFGSRLRLVRLSDGAVMPGTNNVAASTLTARVPLQAAGTDFAVIAAAEGSTGSFAATDLNLSARWQAGLQSGTFTWSYPLRVPEMPGGLKPELGFAYSSGGVDGRMGSANNQPSWVGEGFDLSTGYIQRSYRSCHDDGLTDNYGQCWVSGNATAVFDGLGGELVRDDATGTWRAQEDNGWRVELLTGTVNGDNDGEYWRLTSPAGTQYFFGLNRLPGWASGRPVTNSAFTAPVFGNNPNEPCRGSTPAASWCQQAYRWNLDYVVDRHGDAMSYWYVQEMNNYGRWNGNPFFGETTPYVRGGYLARIDYGQRASTLYTGTAGGRVVFHVADRCTSGSASACDPAVQGNWKNWPDVPWDQRCNSSCTYYWVPTFWTAKRLASVSTQVHTGLGHSNVETWTLRHSYPDPYPASDPWSEPNDASKSLWLNGITHSGESEVKFSGVSMVNRHNSNADFPGMYKWRVSAISNESGGRIEVTYSSPQCGGEPYLIPDRNESRCYPRGDMPSPYAGPDVFYKYVVTKVVERDLVGGNPAQVTNFEYVGPAAWGYDDADTTPTGDRDWNQWRGYQKVRVRTGDPAAGTQSLVEHSFLRGMTGDPNLNGTRKQVTITDSSGGTIDDLPSWRGYTRETIVHNGSGGAWSEKTLIEPVRIRRTASRLRTGLTALEAYLTDEQVERATVALAAGGTRVTELRREFDALGRISRVNDLADLSTPDDDACTRKTYAENQTDWIIDAVARAETVGVRCEATASPADLIADERQYHDGATVWGTPPAKGDVTRIERLTGNGYAEMMRMVPDAHGRAVESYDAAGKRTTVSYTPATGGPLTATSSTNVLGHHNSVTVSREFGTPVKAVDANGRVTEMEYDTLGRLRKAWGPGRDRAALPNAPSAEFVYTVTSTAAPAIESRTLLANGGYASRFAIYDGFLRPRQTQAPSPAGGRIITDQLMDSYGRVDRANAPYWNNQAGPGPVPVSVADSAVPGQTKFLYDGLNRRTAEVFRSLGVEKWRTTNSYGGDWVAEDPPDGGTATMRVFDGLSRLSELRHYTGGSPTGAYDSTRYTYTGRGQLATVTDAAGNVWRYGYDLLGNRIRSEDPDTGVTTASVDAAGRVLSTTDGRGQTLTYRYDDLLRRTATLAGTTLLAEWTYDQPGGLGLASKAIRYADSQPYIQEVLGYDPAGRPTGTATVVPQAEGSLAGRYETTLTYNAAGQVLTATVPAVGDLPAETLQFGYEATTGAPAWLTGTGGTRYVDSVAFTELAEEKALTSGTGGTAGTGQLVRERSYEPGTGRLANTSARTVAAQGGSTGIRNVNYSYDPAGNVTKIHDTVAGDAQCFRTDYLARLVEAWTPASADCAAAPSTALGGPAPYWHSYTYDRIGNRLSEVRHSPAGDTTRLYAYQGNQPHALRTVTTGGSTVDSFSYDADGNLTARPGQQLTWDAEGRLATAGNTSFLYDAEGERLLRRDAAGTTLYLDNAELRRTAAGALQGTRFYAFGETTIAVRTGAKLSWIVADQQGTGQLAVDAATLAVTRRHFLPFGAPRGAAPAGWPGERGFVDGTSDPTGLTHLGAREYDPALGRFISADPLTDAEEPQTLNAYAYALNNPVTLSDPDGLKPKPPKPNPYKDCGGTKRACEYREEQLVKRLKEIEEARKKIKDMIAKLKRMEEEARKREQWSLAKVFEWLADRLEEFTKTPVWDAIKAAATICTLVPGVGTAACGAVTVTMSAIDGLYALKRGDGIGAAIEFAAAATGAVGLIAKGIGTAAKATAKALRKGRDWANSKNVPLNPLNRLRKYWDPRGHPLKPVGKLLDWLARKADGVARRMGIVERDANKMGAALDATGRLYKKIKEEEQDRIRSQL